MIKDLPLKLLLISTIIFVVIVLFIMIRQSIQDTEYIRENDPYDYAKVGESIWNGNGIALNGKAYVLMPPGFPVIAGGFNVIFQNPEISVKFSSILFWIFNIFLFYYLLGFFFREKKYKLIGVLLYAGNSIMILTTAAGRIEPVFLSFLLLFVIMLIIKTTENKPEFISRVYVLSLAVVASVLYYLRPEGLWIAAVLWIVFIFQIKLPVIKKTAYSVIYSAGIIIMISPYVFFLKNHTGRWQLSGKAYANLVMGEMESPYQSAKYGEKEIPYRYTIIERIINNPDVARSPGEYFSESANKIYERIIPNLKSLAISLWFSYSIIGIPLIIFGLLKIPFDHQIWIWGVLSAFGIYLLFFILNRFIAMYQPFFIVMMIGGMIAVAEQVKKTFLALWSEIVIYVLTGLLTVYQLRHITL